MPLKSINTTNSTFILGSVSMLNGELQMVYHPEGVIRPTPASADNQTEYVYDYFVKDYLGNVRVVLTEEDATYETVLVATMEEYRAEWEEENFEKIEEGREPIPFNYPVDASFPFNQFIAKLIADNEMTIGPAKVLEVNQGDRVKLATQYFYEENAPGATYDNLGFLVEEILVSMAAAGAGILPVGEGTLVNLANGSTNLGNHIANFLSNTMDTTGMNRPQAYLVWLAYDKDFKLDPTSSGALRVEDPNELGTLMSGEFPVNKPGYLHVYVANGTASKIINFDNLYVTTMQGKTRQINHYYPFGLRMRLGHGKDYKNMYTSKELQTGEYWHAATSTGLEMYDFGSRFYDPQLGRWFVPDPAEQFANPYLGMGNNPVMYVDPDGEFIFTALALIIPGAQVLLPIAIGADIGALTGGIRGAKDPEVGFWTGAARGAAVGAVGGMMSMIGGPGMSFAANLALGTGQGALTGAMDAALWGTDIAEGALWGAAAGAAFTTLTSDNLNNALKGKGFKTNSNVFKDFSAGTYTAADGVWQQDALDYFGFDGSYSQARPGGGSYVEGNDYFGATSPSTGNISYGDLAFDSYDNLRATYIKESFHSQRVQNGVQLATQNIPEVKNVRYYPEERLGFIHGYKNQGFYPNTSINFPSQINFYQNQSFNLPLNQRYNTNNFFHFIYRLPRRF